MKTVLVSGAIANKPFNGGASWTRLNWLLGLQKLGFDVYFIEQLDPATGPDGPLYFEKVVKQFGLEDRAILIGGELPRRAVQIAQDADLLVNISGHLTNEDLKSRIPVKAFVDLDPGFTQFWRSPGAGSKLAGHDYYFTVGENIGTAGCGIPTDGIRWRPTRQPVVLEEWPFAGEAEPGRFTTVASWRGPFGPVQHNGRTLGSKVRQFRKYAALPLMLGQAFELALDIHPGDDRDRELLCRNGWRLVDPREAAPDPAAFRRYIQGSAAEFSVAQEIYVETRSGWFSDRTVRYLASGKPALVEDTGFSRNYPVGDGLLAFSSLDEAIQGAQEIARNYSRHARAARQVAETWFDSRRVLGELLDQMGMSA